MPVDKPSTGSIGAIVGALIALVAIVILLNGGEHFGKTSVRSDNDLTPIATGR